MGIRQYTLCILPVSISDTYLFKLSVGMMIRDKLFENLRHIKDMEELESKSEKGN